MGIVKRICGRCLTIELGESDPSFCKECMKTYDSYKKMIESLSGEEEGARITASEWVFPFGKYKGSSLGDVYMKDRGYLVWLLGQRWVNENSDQTVKNVIVKILND